MVVTMKKPLNDIVKMTLAFGVAGLVSGAASRGATFLGLGLFGGLCGLVLGLLAHNRRVGLFATVVGAVAFMAGGALAFVFGMAAGMTLGAPDWYDVVLPALMGACVGITGGFGLVSVTRGQGHTWRSAVGLGFGFAIAALLNEMWLLQALQGQSLQAAVSLGLWGLLGGIGFTFLNRSQS